jgi:hypothetical protein
LDALNQDRLTKKAKLADRLNRRRSTAQPAGMAIAGLNAAAAAAGAAGDGSAGQPAAATPAPAAPVKKVTKPAAATGEGVAAAMADPAMVQSIQLIESKLERIEKVISAISAQQLAAKEQVTAPVAPVASPAPSSAVPAVVAYQDRDEPAPGEALILVPDIDIAVQERARIDFGKKLAVMIGIKNLDIQAARSLPPPAASHNAFSNSYFYRPADNVLFVHQNRLTSSGDFGLVVIHALSHIKVSSLYLFLCSYVCDQHLCYSFR